ncbi:hypothetical protein GCM10022217_30290 [Chryseobacterium ginsenosidimutans]|uniref:DUF6705 family protein n=1 Tax=Chryseobacterium ginsenosidimutans TaxID=687846 RepID=UPI0031D8CA30
MKKIIYFLIAFIAINTNAQMIVTMTHNNSRDAQDGNYIKDTEGYLDKFLGTWKYTNSTEEFIIKIVKGEQIAGDGYYIDRLFGGYKYMKDGIVKVNNLNFQYTDYSSPQNFADFSGSGLSTNYMIIGLPGYDRVGYRRVRITLEVIPNTNPIQMKWKMENRENIVINNEGFKQGTGPGLPNNIILIKQ